MRSLLVVPLGLALVACGSKSSDQPKAGSGSAGSAKASSGSAGSGSAGEAPIVLPKGDGTPPHKTAQKLTEGDFKGLSTFEFPSFSKRVRSTTNGLDVRFTTPRPKIGTTVTITNCFTCPPMELDKWTERSDDLKFILSEELRGRPDTKWEIGKTDLNGQLLVYTYQVGHFFGKDENGNPHAAYSDAYALYFNDGVNQIRVVSEYQDAPVSREEMLAIAPKEDLAKIAMGYLDFYTHHWDHAPPPPAELAPGTVVPAGKKPEDVLKEQQAAAAAGGSGSGSSAGSGAGSGSAK